MSNNEVFSSAELQAIRADFPLLERTVRGGKKLVYLDSGATSQKPHPVLDAEQDFYENRNAAVHRGAHQLAEEATEAFESARAAVASFVGVAENEIVWVTNATAGINLVAQAFANASLGLGGVAAGRFKLTVGDEIVVTELEHHANLIPWQQLALKTGASLKVIPSTSDGRLDLTALDVLITERVKIVAFTHASNVTGAITDVAPLVAAANRVGAFTVLDACQSVPHLPVDFKQLNVDFAAFSGHKMFGPTGVGALYGKAELLADLPVVNTGGSMVEVVTLTEATFAPAPQKFEAGTQMVAQAVAMGVAAQYLQELGMEKVASWEEELTKQLLRIKDIPGVRVIGPTDANSRLSAVSFAVDGVHAHDVGQVLDEAGIAVRVGHHCAQPIHRKFGVAATARASAGIYNTLDEVDSFYQALSGVRKFFGLE